MKNQYLINIRKKLNLSQQQVADFSKIDRSYYTKIENGLIPSVKVAQSIAEILNFNWTIFFEKDCVKNAQKQSTA